MKTMYLVALPNNITATEMAIFLDTFPADQITNWFYAFPGSIFVEATIDPRQLSAAFERRFGQLLHAVIRVTEVAGRLPQEQWDILKQFFDYLKIADKS